MDAPYAHKRRAAGSGAADPANQARNTQGRGMGRSNRGGGMLDVIVEGCHRNPAMVIDQPGGFEGKVAVERGFWLRGGSDLLFGEKADGFEGPWLGSVPGARVVRFRAILTARGAGLHESRGMADTR